MKKIITLLLLCLLAGGFAHGKTKSKGKSIHLTISLSAAFYSRLLDSVSLRKDTLHWTKFWKYNGADGTINYNFDSLTKGDYSFFARDIIGLKHSVSFHLAKDTIIRLDGHMGFHPVQVIGKEDLQENMPVYIVYLSNGCFSALKKTGILTKESNEEDTYRLTLYSNSTPLETFYNARIGPAVFDDLFTLQSESRDMQARDILNGMSTSRQEMLIVAGDKLFYFDDHHGSFEWQLCQDFFNKYIHQEFTR